MLTPTSALSPSPPSGNNEVQCPLCRVVTNMGVGGVEELPVNDLVKDRCDELLREDPVRKPFPHPPVVPPRNLVPSK